jgi:polyisoprenoid-binding protein YceI
MPCRRAASNPDYLRLFCLSLVLLLAGCGTPEEHPRSTGATGAAAVAAPAPNRPTDDGRSGRRTFVIVPEASKASYQATEQFFAGALKRLGIAAGAVTAVGSTQAIQGQFQLDPRQPAANPGENTFTVQMNTLTSDRPLRDKYLREDGPKFNEHPVATFRATEIHGHQGSSTGDGEFSFKLAGILTVREVAKPATFDVKARLSGDTLTGIATTRLLMSDFGIEPPDFYDTLTVADPIGLEVEFTARAKTE